MTYRDSFTKSELETMLEQIKKLLVAWEDMPSWIYEYKDLTNYVSDCLKYMKGGTSDFKATLEWIATKAPLPKSLYIIRDKIESLSDPRYVHFVDATYLSYHASTLIRNGEGSFQNRVKNKPKDEEYYYATYLDSFAADNKNDIKTVSNTLASTTSLLIEWLYCYRLLNNYDEIITNDSVITCIKDILKPFFKISPSSNIDDDKIFQAIKDSNLSSYYSGNHWPPILEQFQIDIMTIVGPQVLYDRIKKLIDRLSSSTTQIKKTKNNINTTITKELKIDLFSEFDKICIDYTINLSDSINDYHGIGYCIDGYEQYMDTIYEILHSYCRTLVDNRISEITSLNELDLLSDLVSLSCIEFEDVTTNPNAWSMYGIPTDDSFAINHKTKLTPPDKLAEYIDYYNNNSFRPELCILSVILPIETIETYCLDKFSDNKVTNIYNNMIDDLESFMDESNDNSLELKDFYFLCDKFNSFPKYLLNFRHAKYEIQKFRSFVEDSFFDIAFRSKQSITIPSKIINLDSTNDYIETDKLTNPIYNSFIKALSKNNDFKKIRVCLSGKKKPCNKLFFAKRIDQYGCCKRHTNNLRQMRRRNKKL